MTSDDQVLISAAKRDPQQFEALYKKYFQTIFNYFWYRVGHDADVAEDLTQDTFMRAFASIDRFTITTSSYLSYLLTIAHNRLVNHYRSYTPAPLSAAPPALVELWQDIEAADQLACVWQAVQTLAPFDRDVLYLMYRRGYKIAEIAVITNKSENAIKLAVSRARKKLRNTPAIKRLAELSELPRRPSPPRYRRPDRSS